MKKWFVIALLSVMMLCTISAQAENTKIVFWHSMSEEAGTLMDSYVKSFNETIGKEQGIEVEAVFQGTYAESVTKMNSVLSAGQDETLPDVLQLDATGKVSYLAAEAAYTVDEALKDHPETDLSGLLAPAMSNWSLSGVQLGLPFATSTTVLYYNKTALDAVGAQAPDTFADIAALAALIPTEGDTVIYASVPNTPTLANWLGQIGSNLVNYHNGSEGTADALDCLENGALVTFLTEWKNLYLSGALSNTSGSTDAFVAGKQLMMTSSSSNVASLLEKVGDTFEVGVAGYPRVNAGAAHGATVNGSCLVMFDHGEAKKNAAWPFIQYLTSSEIQADFARGTGYIPSNQKATESDVWKELVKEFPQYEVALTQLMNTPDTMRSVTVGPSADFYYAIMNDMTDYLDADMSPDEGADLMAEDLGGLLEQYKRANQ